MWIPPLVKFFGCDGKSHCNEILHETKATKDPLPKFSRPQARLQVPHYSLFLSPKTTCYAPPLSNLQKHPIYRYNKTPLTKKHLRNTPHCPRKQILHRPIQPPRVHLRICHTFLNLLFRPTISICPLRKHNKQNFPTP